ncbi:ATPase [Croceibacterium mercuriale]|uniref:ATPase n=1 Tax=Croceibacterium mercuriale TaxID=1572751 RepID=A0A0B2C014_9SPHN|nr:ATP-binding protein [Croceibacterium mercuriale]KHL25286.1 ATPase [Croceibacterium mercuriale]
MSEFSPQPWPVAALTPVPVEGLAHTVGTVQAISGAQARLVLDGIALAACGGSADPAIAMAGQVGSAIRIAAPDGAWLLASLRDLEQAADGSVCAIADLLGEGIDDAAGGTFRRGVTRYPLPGSTVHPVATAQLARIYDPAGRVAITVGTVHPTATVGAGLFIDALLGKHFALLGSTGTGKSTAAALILHRICDAAPHGHVVMVDPHGEYGAAFQDRGMVLDVGNLQLPYWLMNFAEHCEVFLTTTGNDRQEDADILARCLLAARGKNRLAAEIGRITVDSPVPYLLSDLLRLVNDEMGQLDKASSSAPFLRIRSKIDELKGDPRYQFMFSGMLVADTMAELIARLFRMDGAGRPITIIDVSGVPSDITATVVAVLSRMVFDHAIWSRGEAVRPILLVCEEAHRYVPGDRQSGGSSVSDVLGRIAKEGRKYGIALGLITQRPSDLAEGVLSQCGTIIAMRLNNERDQAFVRSAMPEGARGFLDAIPALRNREAIICGEGVAVPMRVSFADLEEHRRPASADPLFSALWQHPAEGGQAIARTVRRWRAQGR